MNAAGSRIRAEERAVGDAHVVARLREAGAVLLGRLNTHEFAFGITTNNPHFGATRNPWRRDRVPGGSSGGAAAALAAGLCALALGTDTGGSIRVPAAACGVAGLKPTFGRVSRRGVVPLAWSLDHVGPLARRVGDLAPMLGVIAAPDPEDPWCARAPFGAAWIAPPPSLAGITLGIVRRHFFENLEADVARAVEDAIATLQRLGARAVEVDAPLLDHAYTAFHAILASEAAAYHRPWLATRAADYGDDVRRGLELGCSIPAVDYVDARRLQSELTRQIAAAFSEVDLLVSPTLPRTPPRIGEPMSREPREVWSRNSAAFNLTGVPALSLPCGFDRDGMPIGLQVAGRWWNEAIVLRAGLAFEHATDWHERRPPED